MGCRAEWSWKPQDPPGAPRAQSQATRPRETWGWRLGASVKGGEELALETRVPRTKVCQRLPVWVSLPGRCVASPRCLVVIHLGQQEWRRGTWRVTLRPCDLCAPRRANTVGPDCATHPVCDTVSQQLYSCRDQAWPHSEAAASFAWAMLLPGLLTCSVVTGCSSAPHATKSGHRAVLGPQGSGHPRCIENGNGS